MDVLRTVIYLYTYTVFIINMKIESMKFSINIYLVYINSEEDNYTTSLYFRHFIRS